MSTASALKHAVSVRAQLAIFARDVLEGLSSEQKQIPSQYLYDEVGSALFDAITTVPEYGLTRADERIIARCAPVLSSRISGPLAIAELGSGSGSKTRHILSEFRGRERLLYYPIDVSVSALERCRSELDSFCEVHPVYDTYLAGLSFVAAKRKPGSRLLVLFLGSTIGNFPTDGAEQFLTQVRGMLRPGDLLLVGADLVKNIAQLLVAYDDPAGVTAAFNKNLLCRINRELGADFQPMRFEHEARYDEAHQRIEMHLRSVERQTVMVAALGRKVLFRKGETIWTESSHKFTLEQLRSLSTRCGFRQVAVWNDEEWPFAECLWTVKQPREAAGRNG